MIHNPNEPVPPHPALAVLILLVVPLFTIPISVIVSIDAVAWALWQRVRR